MLERAITLGKLQGSVIELNTNKVEEALEIANLAFRGEQDSHWQPCNSKAH